MTRSLASTQPLLLGLIGSPIKSSAAPSMHEAAAEAAGLRAQYRLIDIPGADQSKLRILMEGVRLLGFSGVNVRSESTRAFTACGTFADAILSTISIACARYSGFTV